MKSIIGYIGGYFYETNKQVLAFTTLLTAGLVFFNYQYGFNEWVDDRNDFWISLLYRGGLFLLAFSLPYAAYSLLAGRSYFSDPVFILFLLAGPLIFSFKVALNPFLYFSDDFALNNFWNYVYYWPVLLIITGGILVVIWSSFDRDQPFYGIKTRQMNWKPYILMLVIMLPLVAAASTQPDFLAMYPKLKAVTEVAGTGYFSFWEKLLFELSYGSDFVTIELFFRGFLVLAFIKWAGKDAILPMACFYCTIHFGKPLGECISSYFGGMILGIIVFHTRSILGGLIVHLGIAWMMELGGHIGSLLRN